MIIPYLSDIVNDHKTPLILKAHSRDEIIDYETKFGEWKIQLIVAINFVPYRDYNETRIMDTKSDNIEMMDSETYYIITELIDFLFQRYQEGLDESMRGCEFVPNGIDLLYYKLQKTSLKRSGSYIKSFQWLKNKKATINPKNDDDNCLHYSITAAVNYQKKKKNHPERVSNIKPFINQYNRLSI